MTWLISLHWTHHRFQPSAQCGWKSGKQLHSLFRLGVEERVSQPLPREHQQLAGKDLFVMDLEQGLRRWTRTWPKSLTCPRPGAARDESVQFLRICGHGYSWPLNNTDLNCMAPLTRGFFSKKTVNVFALMVFFSPDYCTIRIQYKTQSIKCVNCLSLLVVRLPANSGYYELSFGGVRLYVGFQLHGVSSSRPCVVQGSTVQPKYSPNQTPHLKPKFLPSPHFPIQYVYESFSSFWKRKGIIWNHCTTA